MPTGMVKALPEFVELAVLKGCLIRVTSLNTPSVRSRIIASKKKPNADPIKRQLISDKSDVVISGDGFR